MNLSRNISTRVADVSIDGFGIITITMKDAVDVDELDVLDINLIVRHFSNKLPALKLLDSRCNWNISSEAKRKAMEEAALSPTKARAIIVSNKLKSSVLSFIKQFEKREFPQKYFTNIEEAKSWLMSFKQ